MKRITESQFYDLLSLKLSGDATPEELSLLQEQLSNYPEWQFIYDQLLQAPATTVNNDEFADLAYASHVTKMRIKGHFSETNQTDNQQEIESTNNSRVIRIIKYASLVAACFIAFFLVYATIQNKKIISDVAQNEVSTKKGSKSNIKLPDGTQVWLNVNSKITYSNDFANNREVVLVGEAYFDVTHDAEHPFVIHAGNTNIKVLGTAFNIRNYPLDKTLETTLMRGKIEVSFNDRIGDKIIMKPLEKLILHNDEANQKNTQKPQYLVELTTVNYTYADSTVAETSWVNDKMVFINEPLENIALELEQHYAIKIIFKNDNVRKYRYTGVFGNVSIEKVLQIFQISKKIRFRTDGDNVTIF